LRLGLLALHKIQIKMSILPATSEHPAGIEQFPAPEWDAQDNHLNIERLRQAFGWTPEVRLVEDIRRSAAGIHTY
jgi:hypothetical protein